MKVAVIGGGSIGQDHLDALERIQEVEAVAVVELNEERGRQLSERYGIRAYTDDIAMLEAEQPDIAIVALPHYLHVSAALRCISYGCHLMLEKPMALTVEECDQIIEAAERQGVILMIGHTMHYLPENLVAKEIVSRGELGKLVMVHDVRHLDYYPEGRPEWFLEKSKAGGGIITNLGSHSIDKIQWLTNSEFVSVKARMSYDGKRGDVEGAGMLYLESSAGFSATITQSGYPGEPRCETELIFTGGMLKIVNWRGVYVSRGGAYESIPIPASEPPLTLQMRELLGCIREGKQPESCSGAYARSVVAVLESAYRSHQSGTEERVNHR
jgi:predicted dehydrogenase